MNQQTPHNLKVLAGTDRKDRAPPPDAVEFDLLGVFPEPPQHLCIDGAQMWEDLGRMLHNCKVLQVVDLFALEQLCHCWAMYRKKIRAGMDVTAAESNALKALFNEFGMTPASRAKVTAGGNVTPTNKFAGNGKPKRRPA